jgi:hypothetical protein
MTPLALRLSEAHVSGGWEAVARVVEEMVGDAMPTASRRWRHVKRGTTYEEVGRGALQTATMDVVDGSCVVIYRGDDGRFWVREEAEFEDGRFEAEHERIVAGKEPGA